MDATPEPDPARTARDLRIAVGRVARRIKQLYASDDAAGAASFAEISVLARLEQYGPAAPGALAAAEHVTPQAMGAVIGALRQRGEVARAPDPGDGRRVIVTLTDAGRRVLDDRAQAVAERMTTTLRDHFDPDEQRRLTAVLPLLGRFADRM